MQPFILGKAPQAGGVLLLSCFALVGPAKATGCGTGGDPVSKALCADPRAKAADEAMAGAYNALKAGLDNDAAAQLLANQRAWLQARKTGCPADGETEAACLVRWSDMRRRALAAEPEAGPGTAAKLVPVIVAKSGAKGHWSHAAFLFRFADPQTPGRRTFNDAVDKAIAAMPDKMDDAGEGRSGDWTLTGRLSWVSDRLASLEVDGSEFAQGAAHGMQWTQNINVDLRDGKVMTSADILQPGKGKALADLCTDQIRTQLIDDYRQNGQDPDKNAEDKAALRADLAGMRTDIGKITADASHWSFGQDGLTITYDQDAIAAHALGSFACHVPVDQLRNLAKPDAPLPAGAPPRG